MCYFIQHLSKAIWNAKSVKGIRTNQKDQIKELINEASSPDDIVDVFAMAGLERADISILNEEFWELKKKRTA
jgi:type I restriction enzyme R subunit